MRTTLFLLMLILAGCSQGALDGALDQSRRIAPTGAPSPKDLSTKDVSTEDIAQRLATDCAFLPCRQFLDPFTPQDKIAAMDAIARCHGLSASQRAARIFLLTPITWDVNMEVAMLPLQGLSGRTCAKLAKAADKDLVAIAQTWSKNYAGWKDRQQELNRLEMQLNEQITRDKAQAVQAAEKFFRGGQDAGNGSEAVERQLAQSFVRVLQAHPDLEQELRASLRAERAAVTKELQASRAKADSVLRTVDGQP